MTLMLKPNERASYADLARIACPAGTSTWPPIPHTLVVDKVKEAFDASNLPVTLAGEEYGLASEGKRMFGVLNYHVHGETETSLAIGATSSIDRSIGLKYCSGAGMVVCSNLCFSADGIVVSRKHTTHILAHMDEMISRLLAHAWSQYKTTKADLDSLKGLTMTDDMAYAAFGVALGRGWLTPARLSRAMSYWRKPPHVEHQTRDLFAWYQACNHGLKTSAPQDSLAHHGQLHQQALQMREGVSGAWEVAPRVLPVVEAAADVAGEE